MPSTLRIVGSLFGPIFIAFGINAMLRPRHSLTFFPFAASDAIPSSDAALLDALLVVYGARDIFMGVVTMAAAAFGDRRLLGFTLIAGGAVAGVDGWVVKGYERAGVWGVGGEWNHWGYGPMVGVVSAPPTLRRSLLGTKGRRMVAPELG